MRKVFIILGLTLAPVFAACGEAGQDNPYRMGPATIKAMKNVLRNGIVQDKTMAAIALGNARVSDAAALEVLRVLLKEEYLPARLAAVYALGRCGRSEAVKLVAGLLDDDSSEVKIAACKALGELKDQSNISSLPFVDDDPFVRIAAVMLIKKTRAAHALPELLSLYEKEKNPQVRAAILDACLIAPKKCGKLLVSSLADGDGQVVVGGLRLLARQNASNANKHAAAVRALLSDRRSLVKCAAVLAAGAVFGADTDKILQALANDSDHTVRKAVALAMAKTSGDEAMGCLSKMLSDGDREVRRAAAVALAACAEEKVEQFASAEKIALAAVGSSNIFERIEGLWILGEIKSQAGFPVILKLAVGQISNPAKKGSPKQDLRLSRMVMWVVARTGYPQGVDLAMKYFEQDFDNPAKAHAARALGVIKDEKSVELLGRELRAIRVEMGVKSFVMAGMPRKLTIWALAQIGTDAALNELARAAAIIDPMPLEENISEICRILSQKKFAGAVRLLTHAIERDKISAQQQSMLADTVAAISGKRPQVKTYKATEVYGDFFINVQEKR